MTVDVETAPRTKRTVYYANESFVDETTGNFMVVAIVEDEAGYSPTTYTGDLEYVVDVANYINDRLGHTREEVLSVVASSMRVGKVADNEVP